VTRVLLVGLGRIAHTHIAVLDRLASVSLVAGVDPAPWVSGWRCGSPGLLEERRRCRRATWLGSS